MYIYIIFFLLSFICIYIGEKYEEKKKHSIAFEILGILVLAFLAAIRDSSIGTDVKAYVGPIFDFYTQYGVLAFKENLIYNVEIGYKVFNYIIAIFTNNFSVLLFCIQLFILSFSFLGIKKLYPKNYTLPYILFILFTYNNSLNMVRQSMALSLCIFALPYLFKEDYKKFFAMIIIASLFHKSSLIFGIIFIIYILIVKKKINPYILATTIFGFGIILFIFFPQLINIFINLHLIPSKYAFYLEHYVLEKMNFNCIDIMIDLFLIGIYIIFSKVYNYKDEKSSFYFILVVISLVALIIAGRYTPVYRISIYFSIVSILYILSNLNLIWVKKDNKKINLNWIGILIGIIFWLWVYAHGNAGETIPFVSIFK